MPYIVTTKFPTPNLPDDELPAHLRRAHWPLVSRRAVVTLEEVRESVAYTVICADQGHHRSADEDAARSLPESGGTIGLPDGTVIEVEQVTRGDLWESIPASLPGAPNMPLAKLIDAFNAREATR